MEEATTNSLIMVTVSLTIWTLGVTTTATTRRGCRNLSADVVEPCFGALSVISQLWALAPVLVG